MVLGVKNLPINAEDTRDMGSILGSRYPGIENGNPLQYSCLENSMDRRAWRGTVHGAAKSQTRLSDYSSGINARCPVRSGQSTADRAVWGEGLGGAGWPEFKCHPPSRTNGLNFQ